MSKKSSVLSVVSLVVCELFTVATVAGMVAFERYHCLPMAVGTVFLLLLPLLCQRFLQIRLSLPLYLFMLFYAMGPMLGQCYQLYYRLNWWDKLLHALGGVMFALVGLYLFARGTEKNGKNPLMAAVFALCFSMAISMLWEFCEFGVDRFFGTDMQQDTLVSGFHSYLLGTEVGVTGSVEGITEVLVNGQALPGYIDIGLIDTMLDMLFETLGAVLVAVLHICTKGKIRYLRSSG